MTGAQMGAPAPVRSSLDEFVGLGDLAIVRSCCFSFPAKILTPVDDILVPLITRDAFPDLMGRSGIAGVIATPELADCVPPELGLGVAPDPMLAHHLIHAALAKMPGRLALDFATEIDPSATIDPRACIAPRNVRIGPGAVVMAFASVHERSILGAGTRIHSQAVIGADAYEIVMVDGMQRLRAQTGGVTIGDNCEILSGSIVTRAAFCGATVLGDNTILDCNVTLSHDVHLGANVRIGGSSWLGGRVGVGDRVTVGPNCTIANGLNIGTRAKISLGSVVTRDVDPYSHVSGNFAIEHDKFIAFLRSVR